MDLNREVAVLQGWTTTQSNKVMTGTKPREAALFTPSWVPQAPLRQDHTTIFGSGKAWGLQSWKQEGSNPESSRASWHPVYYVRVYHPVMCLRHVFMDTKCPEIVVREIPLYNTLTDFSHPARLPGYYPKDLQFPKRLLIGLLRLPPPTHSSV